jgi:metal-dependent HD superfamily phosphatase/phosphodiesterase
LSKPIVLDDVKRNPEVIAYIERSNEVLASLGYTEHSFRHVGLVAHIAHNILTRLGDPPRDAELAGMAGYLHDIGNVASRLNHGQTGALLSADILRRMGMAYDEVARVMGAIGNHDDDVGQPVSRIGAALLLADKSDVHRTRVRAYDPATFDIHDRVNYAAEKSFVRVDERAKTITLELTVDTKISPVMEYFEIFLTRMVMCRRAASFLGCNFELSVNESRLL